MTLDENLVDTGGGVADAAMVAGSIAATNVFALDGTGRWRLVVHHGSPIALR